MALSNARFEAPYGLTGRVGALNLGLLDVQMKHDQELGDKNLLVGVAGANVLRLAPPLVITDEHVREATGIMDAAIAEWEPED